MCGILCVFGPSDDIVIHPEKLSRRGPDSFKKVQKDDVTMYFYRLSIRGGPKSIQPIDYFMCNGEIYNHEELGGSPNESDCVTLKRQIDKIGIIEGCRSVQHGEFAFCYLTEKGTLLAGRDPHGVRPLYYCRPTPKTLIFSSELKAIDHYECKQFPPGYYYSSDTNQFVKWYQVSDHTDLKKSLIAATVDRIRNTDRDVCFLLSGGLDSSLVCAIAYFHGHVECLNLFTVGQDDSPDVISAKKVVDFLRKKGAKVVHTIIPFDFENASNLVPNVIQTIESYDTTTVRASTPMWILSRYIAQHTDFKVLLSGEGSDELLAGYRYFKNAPNAEDLHNEILRRLENIHYFDGLRADRCTSSWGLELRVPFLDSRVVASCLAIDPREKMTPCEKECLRRLFVDYLPPEILWRSKEAFSDAVGYDWVTFQTLKYSDYPVTQYEYNSPLTGEESFYRETFEKFYGSRNAQSLPEMWRPLWTDVLDPSARYLKTSSDTLEDEDDHK